MPKPANSPLAAYVTTSHVGGTRERIQGERIIVVLGEDDDGNQLELSIDLMHQSNQPMPQGVVSVAALLEPLPTSRPKAVPTLTAKQGAANTVQLKIQYKKLPD